MKKNNIKNMIRACVAVSTMVANTFAMEEDNATNASSNLTTAQTTTETTQQPQELRSYWDQGNRILVLAESTNGGPYEHRRYHIGWTGNRPYYEQTISYASIPDNDDFKKSMPQTAYFDLFAGRHYLRDRVSGNHYANQFSSHHYFTENHFNQFFNDVTAFAAITGYRSRSDIVFIG